VNDRDLAVYVKAEQARSESARLFGEDDHIHQLDRCLSDDSMPLDLRAGGALVLMFGLHPSRVMQLTKNDVADLSGISISTAERWSRWAKRDWTSYIGQRAADVQAEAPAARTETFR
jgi:hypothetical protein